MLQSSDDSSFLELDASELQFYPLMTNTKYLVQLVLVFCRFHENKTSSEEPVIQAKKL